MNRRSFCIAAAAAIVGLSSCQACRFMTDSDKCQTEITTKTGLKSVVATGIYHPHGAAHVVVKVWLWGAPRDDSARATLEATVRGIVDGNYRSKVDRVEVMYPSGTYPHRDDERGER